jgi:hypothetical protein
MKNGAMNRISADFEIAYASCDQKKKSKNRWTGTDARKAQELQDTARNLKAEMEAVVALCHNHLQNGLT